MANGSLMVKSIQKEDKGIFICTIEQSRGTESTSDKSRNINVSVIGKMRKIYWDLEVLNQQYKVKNSQSLTKKLSKESENVTGISLILFLKSIVASGK